MQKRFIKHLSVLVIGLGAVLYVAQNCGEEQRNFRTARSGSSVVEESNSDQLPMDQIDLSINIDGEEISQAQAAGLSLVPTVANFKATLLCGSSEPVNVTTSPVLISANSDCKVGLTELSFGGLEGTYVNVKSLVASELVQGAKHIFQNANSEQLIVQITSQFNIENRKAGAAFRFYQVRRDATTATGILKEFVVDGQLAPDLRVSSVDMGMSNAGIVLRTTFRCSSAFQGANGKFTCGDFASDDLNLVYEPIVKMIDLDGIERESPDSVDGPNGLISMLSIAAKPLSQYPFVLTQDGFILSIILGDVNSGRYAGLAEQILLGVGTSKGGVATTVINIDIQQ